MKWSTNQVPEITFCENSKAKMTDKLMHNIREEPTCWGKTKLCTQVRTIPKFSLFHASLDMRIKWFYQFWIRPDTWQKQLRSWVLLQLQQWKRSSVAKFSFKPSAKKMSESLWMVSTMWILGEFPNCKEKAMQNCSLKNLKIKLSSKKRNSSELQKAFMKEILLKYSE